MTHSKIVFSSAGEAFHRTLDLLFKPFSWQRWGRFILIAWLAGGLSGGCSLGSSGGSHSASTVSQSPSSAAAVSPSLGKKIEKQHEKKYWFEHSLIKSAKNNAAKVPAWYMNVVIWPVAVFVLLLVIAFVMFWIWLSAHFQFVWIHAVRTGEMAIRRPFKLYEIPADSLATFSCWAALATLFYYLALFAMPVWAIYRTMKVAPKALGDMTFLLSAFWPWLLLLIFSIAVTALFFSIVSDFVVPLMAAEPILFKEAFGKWLSIYKRNRFAVWRYFGMKMVASVLGGALTMASAVMVFLAFALAGALLFGALYLVCAMLFKVKILFWILAVVFGLPFAAALIFCFSLCALPVSVFFRAFSLSFLDKLTLAPSEV